MVKLMLAMFFLTLSFITDLEAPTMNETEIFFVKKTLPYNDQYERVFFSLNETSTKRLNVSYEVKEQDIYVECSINDFTFSKENVGSVKKEGEGHIQLYINNNKVDSIFQPSFIIKSLPKGTYLVKLVLIHNDFSSYGIVEEFEITI